MALNIWPFSVINGLRSQVRIATQSADFFRDNGEYYRKQWARWQETSEQLEARLSAAQVALKTAEDALASRARLSASRKPKLKVPASVLPTGAAQVKSSPVIGEAIAAAKQAEKLTGKPGVNPNEKTLAAARRAVASVPKTRKAKAPARV